LVAAVELLEHHSQARFNQVVLRLGLEEKSAFDSAGVQITLEEGFASSAREPLFSVVPNGLTRLTI
jgi:hypothetical protein